MGNECSLLDPVSGSTSPQAGARGVDARRVTHGDPGCEPARRPSRRPPVVRPIRSDQLPDLRHPSVQHRAVRGRTGAHTRYRRSRWRLRWRRLAAAAIGAGALVVLAAPLWGHPSAGGLGEPARVIVVQPGETVASIAQQFDPGSSSRRLQAALRSELDGGRLVPGSRLVVPGS
jgi:hypothetical protein